MWREQWYHHVTLGGVFHVDYFIDNHIGSVFCCLSKLSPSCHDPLIEMSFGVWMMGCVQCFINSKTTFDGRNDQKLMVVLSKNNQKSWKNNTKKDLYKWPKHDLWAPPPHSPSSQPSQWCMGWVLLCCRQWLLTSSANCGQHKIQISGRNTKIDCAVVALPLSLSPDPQTLISRENSVSREEDCSLHYYFWLRRKDIILFYKTVEKLC